MNYTANTQHWQVGDVVIHDADAKKPEMLMKVIGYDRSGACQTVYLHPHHFSGMDSQYTNDIQLLHAPSRFGL